MQLSLDAITWLQAVREWHEGTLPPSGAVYIEQPDRSERCHTSKRRMAVERTLVSQESVSKATAIDTYVQEQACDFIYPR